MGKMRSAALFCGLWLLTACSAISQPLAAQERQAEVSSRHVELAPLVDFWLLQYAHGFTDRDQVVAGLAYTNPDILGAIEHPGSVEFYSIEVGYRRFLTGGLNLEVDVLSSWVDSYDELLDQDFDGFALATELRLGYQFAFQLFDVPSLINLQWFAGYKWFNPVSENFVDVDGGHDYLSPVPIILLGVRL